MKRENKVESNLPANENSFQERGGDEETAYRHLFAWAGLLHILQESTVEECDTDITIMRKVLLDAFRYAKNYAGMNPQLKSGFEEMLRSVDQFSSFYPELSAQISE